MQKILKLEVRNVKKISNVVIEPNKNLIFICGKNGEGKSSLLDTIQMAIGGYSKAKNGEKPIQEGQERAEIILELDEIIVKRIFTAKGTKVTIKNKDGLIIPKPQDALDKLHTNLSFDPAEFARLSAKEQVEILLGLINLEVDIDELEELDKVDFDERTIINREIKSLQANHDSIVLGDNPPQARVDVVKITQEIQALNEINRVFKSVIENGKFLKKEIDSVQEEIKRLTEKEDEMQAEIDTLRDSVKGQKQQDTAGLQETLESAEKTNAEFAKVERKAEIAVELKSKEKNAEKLTENMEARKTQKKDALEKADMPISGLSFENGGVSYNDIPFKQASTAEQLKVSTAIAMASNSELRVIRIKEGSLMDKESLETIGKMADEKGYQVWVEYVCEEPPETSGVCVVLENGELTG